jgi:hypothetical protein
MAVKLNGGGEAHAKRLIGERRVAIDDRDAWSEHQPSAEEENRFIDEHGWDAFARWHLGVDDEHRPETKGSRGEGGPRPGEPRGRRNAPVCSRQTSISSLAVG